LRRTSSPHILRAVAATRWRHRGGSISAEHGIGRARAKLEHYKQPVELGLMRAVKRALRSQGIINRGKVVPT